MLNRKYLMMCGVLAPIIYLGAVVFGGLLRPGYSHVASAISELIAAGAPNKPLLDTLFTLYDILLVGFGAGLLGAVARGGSRRRSGAGGALVLIACGLLGVLMNLFFPQDPGGPPVTVTGTVHVALAGVVSLGTMLAMLGVGRWLRGAPGQRAYGTYSLVSLALVFVSGLLAAAALARGSHYLGLAERVTIGAFVQWVFVVALRLSGPAELAGRDRAGALAD